MRKKVFVAIVLTLSMICMSACGKEKEASVPEAPAEVSSEPDEAASTDLPEDEVVEETPINVEVIGDYTVDDLKEIIPGDNFLIESGTDAEGYAITIGTAGDDSLIGMKVAYDNVTSFEYDIYTIGDDMYAYYAAKSDGTEGVRYLHAPYDSSLSEGDDSATYKMNFDDVISIKCDSTVEYEGTTYDLVYVTSYDTASVMYGFETDDDGELPQIVTEYYIEPTKRRCDFVATSGVISKITHLDNGIELPATFKSVECEEVTTQDIADIYSSLLYMSLPGSENTEDSVIDSSESASEATSD